MSQNFFTKRYQAFTTRYVKNSSVLRSLHVECQIYLVVDFWTEHNSEIFYRFDNVSDCEFVILDFNLSQTGLNILIQLGNSLNADVD